MNLRSPGPGLCLLAGAAVVLGALGAPPAAAASDDAERVAKLMKRAAVERDRGHHEKAAELFAEADEAAGGRSVHAIAGLCQEYHALGRWDEAIAAAERWIELAPTPETRAGGQHYLGVALYQRAVEERYRPADAGGAPERAEVAANSFRRAEEALRLAAAGVTHNRHLTLLSLADTLVRLGEHGEALEVLDQYGAAAPDADPLAGELRCWSERVVAGVDGSEKLGSAEVPEGEREITPPRKLHTPPPQYTERARKMGVQGTILIEAVVDKAGRVACARVVRGVEPSLDRSVIDTVKTWRFDPARRDGEPVEVPYNLIVSMSLEQSLEQRVRSW